MRHEFAKNGGIEHSCKPAVPNDALSRFSSLRILIAIFYVIHILI